MACVARRIGLLLAATLSALAAVGVMPAGAVQPAAPVAGSLSVELTRLTPSVLTPGADLTVQGVVRNNGRSKIAGAAAYVRIPTNPFVNHRGARQSIIAKTIADGHRVVGASDTLNTLQPGGSRRFTIRVEYDNLEISAAEGVYPLSVHVGTGDVESIGHTTTFLPLRYERPRPVPTTVVWPFLRPNGGLAESIRPGGQLRHLLDLARSTPRSGSDVVIDPALVSQARAIATGEPTEALPRAAREAAQDFAADLVRLARKHECWATSYDRPDAAAVNTAPDDLRDLVGRATRATLRAYGLQCQRLEWPAAPVVSRAVLVRMATSTVIVSGTTVPYWQSIAGPLVNTADHQLVVNDRVDAGLGRQTPLTLRQRILSEATWSALSRTVGGRDTTVIVIDPNWDPGEGGRSHLKVALNNKYVHRIGLDEQIEAGTVPYDAALGGRGVSSVSPSRLTAATEAARVQVQLRRVLVERSANLNHDQRVATAISERWRARPEAGERYALDINRNLHEELDDLAVEGPAALTLSSAKGRFPVTIRNGTSHQVDLGTTISSTNPAVKLSIPPGSVIAAGESRTLTASIDMDGQSSTTVTINLMTKDGVPLGTPSVFNVRSSGVGAALWVAIGLSVAFVVVSLLRRFAGSGHPPEHVPAPPEDFDD